MPCAVAARACVQPDAAHGRSASHVRVIYVQVLGGMEVMQVPVEEAFVTFGCHSIETLGIQSLTQSDSHIRVM